jgi:hypothetical protein
VSIDDYPQIHPLNKEGEERRKKKKKKRRRGLSHDKQMDTINYASNPYYMTEYSYVDSYTNSYLCNFYLFIYLFLYG